jgi:hypothetical protein
MKDQEYVQRDPEGWLKCSKCGGTEFNICQPPGEWNTFAACPKCKLSESIHSG